MKALDQAHTAMLKGLDAGHFDEETVAGMDFAGKDPRETLVRIDTIRAQVMRAIAEMQVVDGNA